MSKAFYLDVSKRLPGFTVKTVFDVGANVGQTVQSVTRAFPHADVYSFEPVSATFSALKAMAESLPNVKTFNLALGRETGRATMSSDPLSVNNSVLRDDESGGELVNMVAGADFCADNGVDHISYLKIDTEGFDLDVLIGFMPMLLAHQIDLVQVEASMNPVNRKHVQFAAFCGLLEPLGYYLFGVYDQTQEFSRYSYLRRTNPVFISNRIPKQHRSQAAQ